MAKPLDTENLRVIFNKIMQSHQLKPHSVKKERSNIAVSDKGEFQCGGCVHKWQSNFSWVTFDLIHLEIVYRWKMKCMFCLIPCTPTFTVTQLESMFEKVVRFYKGEFQNTEVNIGYGARRIYHQPHLPDLCERCRWGIDQCWTRKFYY